MVIWYLFSVQFYRLCSFSFWKFLASISLSFFLLYIASISETPNSYIFKIFIMFYIFLIILFCIFKFFIISRLQYGYFLQIDPLTLVPFHSTSPLTPSHLSSSRVCSTLSFIIAPLHTLSTPLFLSLLNSLGKTPVFINLPAWHQWNWLEKDIHL